MNVKSNEPFTLEMQNGDKLKVLPQAVKLRRESPDFKAQKIEIYADVIEELPKAEPFKIDGLGLYRRRDGDEVQIVAKHPLKGDYWIGARMRDGGIRKYTSNGVLAGGLHNSLSNIVAKLRGEEAHPVPVQTAHDEVDCAGSSAPTPEYTLPEGFTACKRGEVPTDLVAGDLIFVWDDQDEDGDSMFASPNGVHTIKDSPTGACPYEVEKGAPPYRHGIVGYKRVASAPKPFKFGDKVRDKISGATGVILKNLGVQIVKVWFDNEDGVVTINAYYLERLPE